MYRIKNLSTKRFVFGKLRFHSYEEARTAARSYIRKMVKAGKEIGHIGFMDGISRNPTQLGYLKIVKEG